MATTANPKRRTVRFYRASSTKKWGWYRIPIRQTLVFTPVCMIQVVPRCAAVGRVFSGLRPKAPADFGA